MSWSFCSFLFPLFLRTEINFSCCSVSVTRGSLIHHDLCCINSKKKCCSPQSTEGDAALTSCLCPSTGKHHYFGFKTCQTFAEMNPIGPELLCANFYSDSAPPSSNFPQISPLALKLLPRVTTPRAPLGPIRTSFASLARPPGFLAAATYSSFLNHFFSFWHCRKPPPSRPPSSSSLSTWLVSQGLLAKVQASFSFWLRWHLITFFTVMWEFHSLLTNFLTHAHWLQDTHSFDN